MYTQKTELQKVRSSKEKNKARKGEDHSGREEGTSVFLSVMGKVAL